ncbi:MAG: helix-turn-helix domain-containing protein [Rhizomicrobium sp.]
MVASGCIKPELCGYLTSSGAGVAQELVSNSDDFAARLSLALNATNLSRTQLSATLGVHKSLVSRWLSGQVIPTSYNLARISTTFAKLKPGFNMTLWTADRRDFEAALGLSAAAALLHATNEVVLATPAHSGGAAAHFPARVKLLGKHWPYAAVGAVLLLMMAFGAWLLWHNAHVQPNHDAQVPPAHSATSVAVLPFLNMSGDPAKEYLGDGMSEEILNDLANTPNLRVAARTSAFFFKGKQADIGEIARKLNVRAVLEGSVRQEGDRVRIVAQLINAADGFHLWSARYDRKLNDILAVQDEIARAIAAALGQRLAPKQPRKIDPAAYQTYLQAQYFFNQRTPASLRRARDLVGEAIARQPNFADAYALRGHVLMLIGGETESQRMIAQALKLDPSNSEALDTHLQIALGNSDWETLYRDAHRLMTKGRRDALYYNGIAFFYQYMGFPKEALEARRQAAQLEPLHFPYVHNLALALSHVGHLRDAVAADKAALELQPNHMLVLSELCALSAIARDLASARDYSTRLATVPAQHITWSNYPRLCEIEIALSAGDAQRLNVLLDHFDKKNWYASGVGMLYARAGNLTGAIPYFTKAYSEGELPALIFAQYDFMTPRDLLRDARWHALWQRPRLRQWQRYHDKIAVELGQARH